MSNRTNNMLRRNCGDARAHKVLGCSPAAFCAHIARKIEHWNALHARKMSIADIQLDHIKPLSLARSAADVAVLTHYSNLQPLFATDNRVKGNKWSAADNTFWRRRISMRAAFTDTYWPAACASRLSCA